MAAAAAAAAADSAAAIVSHRLISVTHRHPG